MKLKNKLLNEQALINSNFRSVRLDIYAHDELEVGYNIEAQNKDEYNLPKRSRYHQAEMDVSSLKPGEDFNDLKPGYVIFICAFDPFGEGLYRYTFEERCLEWDIPLGDETRKIFLNTKGRNAEEVPPELVHFLHYMEESTTEYVSTLEESSLIRLHEKVSNLKKRRELEAGFMTLEEYMRQEIEERVATELEERMQTELEQQKRTFLSEGKVQGLVESILELLSEHGSIPEELEQQILTQFDTDVLKKWFKLAAHTDSVEEFAAHISENS